MDRPFELRPRSSPAAISPGHRRARSRASSAATSTRSCSASPARARPSRSPTSSQQLQRPTLIMAHNKTLAAQLYGEFRELFPENAVEYFVSYYDYYQPEAYVPSSDTYIEKDSIINDEIDRMRHAATRALLSRARRDHRRVGLLHLRHRLGRELPRAWSSTSRSARSCGATSCCAGWSTSSTSATTSTSTAAPSACAATSSRSSPPTRRRRRMRIEFFGDEIESISEIDPAARQGRSAELERVRHLPRLALRDAGSSSCARAIEAIRDELRERLAVLRRGRSSSRSSASSSARMYDLEMLEQMGFCNGIENYSRHLSGRDAGRAAADADRLLPEGLPAHRRRVAPDGAAGRRRCTAATARARRRWSSYGFRLPSRARQPAAQVRGVRGPRAAGASTSRRRRATTSSRRARAWSSSRSSARPGCSIPRSRCARSAARSTTCSARSASASRSSERVLVTTLTKRMAEDLTEYYAELGVKVRYLHSRHRHARAHRDPARSAPRRVRRARRHQPAARGPRPARGVAGGDPRRRQGGLPAQPALAHPDHRPRRAQRRRRVIMYADTHHRRDEAGHRRDRAPPRRSRRRTTRSTASRPRR